MGTLFLVDKNHPRPAVSGTELLNLCPFHTERGPNGAIVLSAYLVVEIHHPSSGVLGAKSGRFPSDAEMRPFGAIGVGAFLTTHPLPGFVLGPPLLALSTLTFLAA